MAIDFSIKNSNKVEGVKIIRPTVSTDDRGALWSTYTSKQVGYLLPDGLKFNHDKFASSKKRVLRGIHGDQKSWKMISCVYGRIYQVVVDCRKESDTYLNWESFSLGSDNKNIVLLPPGVGNAFYVESDIAVYHYKLSYQGEYSDFQDQFTYKWDSELFGIDWPDKNPILSARDSKEGL